MLRLKLNHVSKSGPWSSNVLRFGDPGRITRYLSGIPALTAKVAWSMFVINETIVDIALLYCIVPLCFGVFILYNLLDMFKQFEAIPDLLLQF